MFKISKTFLRILLLLTFGLNLFCFLSNKISNVYCLDEHCVHTEKEFDTDTSNHTFTTQYIWDNNYTSCTAKQLCSSNSSHVITTKASSIQWVVDSAGTCYNKEKGHYIAKFEDNGTGLVNQNSPQLETTIKHSKAAEQYSSDSDYVQGFKYENGNYYVLLKRNYKCAECGQTFSLNKYVKANVSTIPTTSSNGICSVNYGLEHYDSSYPPQVCQRAI